MTDTVMTKRTFNDLDSTRSAICDSYSFVTKEDLLIELKAEFESRYAFELAVEAGQFDEWIKAGLLDSDKNLNA